MIKKYIEKHRRKTDKISIRINVNKIENRITFKINQDIILNVNTKNNGITWKH